MEQSIQGGCAWAAVLWPDLPEFTAATVAALSRLLCMADDARGGGECYASPGGGAFQGPTQRHLCRHTTVSATPAVRNQTPLPPATLTEPGSSTGYYTIGYFRK